MTTCLRFRRRVAAATRCGSSASSASGLPVGDRAESAGAGAAVAGDHESGGAFAPTSQWFGHLALSQNRVQPEVVQQMAGLAKGVGRGQFPAQPFRDAPTRFDGASAVFMHGQSQPQKFFNPILTYASSPSRARAE